MTVTVCKSSLTALEHNEQMLRQELEATIGTLKATLQAQGTMEMGLRDRIFHLEREAEGKDQRIKELERKLQSERVAAVATTRQVQQLQDRVAVLEKKERILTEATAIMEALEATLPAQAKNWQQQEEAAIRSSTHRASIQAEMIAGSKAYYSTYLLAPSHLLPLLKVLEEARHP